MYDDETKVGSKGQDGTRKNRTLGRKDGKKEVNKKGREEGKETRDKEDWKINWEEKRKDARKMKLKMMMMKLKMSSVTCCSCGAHQCVLYTCTRPARHANEELKKEKGDRMIGWINKYMRWS